MCILENLIIFTVVILCVCNIYFYKYMYLVLHVTLFRVQIGHNLCIKTGRGIRMFSLFVLCALLGF